MTQRRRAQLIRRYRHTHKGMKIARRPTIQVAAPASDAGTPPMSAYVPRGICGQRDRAGLGERLQPVGHARDRYEHRAREHEREDHHEARRLSGFGTAHGQRDEREDPTEREPEGAYDGDARECVQQSSLEAEADHVADRRHQRDDQDVAHEVGQRAAYQHRRARHRHRAEAIDDAALEVLGQADRRLRRAERDRLHEDARQQEVDVIDSGGQRAPHRAAEDVREQQHEHDRLDRREDEQLRLADEVAQVAARHDARIG